MGNYSDELRAEGMAQGMALGRIEERAEVLEVLGISKEEYERKLAEKKCAEDNA